MSQYPKFYDKYLENYQVLPRPYLGTFRVILEKIDIIKWLLDLTGEAEIFFWGCIERTKSNKYWKR